MFYQIFLKLCAQKNVKPNHVTKAIGMSNATATDWKNGRIPRDVTLQKLADYFGVSVDYLLGKEQEKNPTAKILSLSDTFTPREIAVVIAYRTHPSEQAAVDKLLDVPTTPEEITVYNAAYFGEPNSEGFRAMPGAKWSELKNTPPTDQDLT